MGFTSVFLINDVPIRFTAFDGMFSGITVHPDAFNEFDEDRVIEAIKVARDVYNDFVTYASIENDHYNIAENTIRYGSDEERDALYKKTKEALGGNVFELSLEGEEKAKRIIEMINCYQENGVIPYKEKPEVKKPKRKPKPGYVYLVQAIAPDEHYKIGFSKEPIERIESMGVKLPYPIEPVHLIPTNDMEKAEKKLHKRFADKRLEGEWFELTPDDVAYICELERLDI